MKAATAAILTIALLVVISGCIGGSAKEPGAGADELSTALSSGKATLLEFYSDT